MIQLWTIVDLASGAVLCPCYPTPAAGCHPRHHGWPWVSGAQHAIRIAAQPDPAVQAWNGEAWIEDIVVLRARRWADVKAARDRAEWTGCDTPLGRVDTDPDSQRKVSGAVLAAMIARDADAPFTVAWTMGDDSTATQDGPAMIAMGVAVGDHVAACHAVGIGKRGALEAAIDAAGVAAINPESGWPE